MFKEIQRFIKLGEEDTLKLQKKKKLTKKSNLIVKIHNVLYISAYKASCKLYSVNIQIYNIKH
jgi:hypothetical protein